MSKYEVAEKLLKEILDFIGIKPSLAVEEGEEGSISISINDENLSFLIGYRGESLNALQTILTLALFRELNDWTHVSVDINNYRGKRREKIEEITRSYIDKVRFFGKEVELPVMSPYERRQVHVFISGYDDINSESTGEGSSRRVVLKPI